MKKQALKTYIPLLLYTIAIVFLFRKEFIISGSIIIIAGISMIILKRYAGEIIILVGLLILSLSFNSIFTTIIAFVLLPVGIYHLIQIWDVNAEIKKSGKQITGEQRLSAYREKELLYSLLKKTGIVK